MITYCHSGKISDNFGLEYAIQFALSSSEKKITILHVITEKGFEDNYDEKFNTLISRVNRFEIECKFQGLKKVGSIEKSIKKYLGRNPTKLLICGIKRTGRKGSYDSSRAKVLLNIVDVPVMAIKISNLGILGCPSRILLPLSDHPKKLFEGLSIFADMINKSEKTTLFFVKVVSFLRYKYFLTPRHWKDHIMKGRKYCQNILQNLSKKFEIDEQKINYATNVSDDEAKEIISESNKLKSNLVIIILKEKKKNWPWKRSLEEKLASGGNSDFIFFRGVKNKI